MALNPTIFLKPWPLGIASAGALFSIVFGGGWPLILALPVAVGVAVAPYYARDERLVREVVRRGGLDPQSAARLRAVNDRLRRLLNLGGVAATTFKVRDQVRSAHERFIGFCDVLEQRFSAKELSYRRYLEAAVAVYRHAMAQLERAVTQLEAMARVDDPALRARLRQLERSQPDHREIETLQTQLSVREEALAEAERGMLSAQDACTRLLAASATLAKADIGPGLTELGSNSAIQELQVLADRAKQYEKR